MLPGDAFHARKKYAIDVPTLFLSFQNGTKEKDLAGCTVLLAGIIYTEKYSHLNIHN